jgi:hypothetical protein
MKRIHAAAWAALALCISGAAHGQAAGANVISLGWLRVMPQDSSTPLTTYVSPQPINMPLRLPSSFTSSGTGLSTTNADTAGLVISHFFTDHIARTTVARRATVVQDVRSRQNRAARARCGARYGRSRRAVERADREERAAMEPGRAAAVLLRIGDGALQTVCGRWRVLQLVLGHPIEP